MKSITKLSDKQIETRLTRWFELATAKQIEDGINWYVDANWQAEQLAYAFDVSPYKCAAVISVLSPRNKWRRNLQDAFNVIATFKKGGDESGVKVCTFNANKKKAFDVLRGDLIAESSPKTHSFATNVSLLSSHVTVDSWHLRACQLLESEIGTPTVDSCSTKQYRRVERITLELANEFDLKGYEFQAIVWIVVKAAYKKAGKR